MSHKLPAYWMCAYCGHKHANYRGPCMNCSRVPNGKREEQAKRVVERVAADMRKQFRPKEEK